MQKTRQKISLTLCALIFGGTASPLLADSVAYHYDALGRLIETYNSRTGYRDKYALDTADNRSNVEVRDVIIRLNAAQSIYSPDKRFQLTMQNDGNFVLYGPSGALWSASTSGSGNWATMQNDGNLVVYNSSNQPLWSTYTGGNPAAELDVQSDGNVVIYTDTGSAIWSTGTGGH